jgi:serine/threonine protein phosphatase PrpC
MRILSCGVTDVGLKRGHNEDNFLINEELNLFVVADGMGGHVGGEYASAISVNTVEEIVMNLELHGHPIDVEDPEDPVDLTRERLRYAIRLAGRRIHEKAKEEPEYNGMGTTAVALLVENGNAFVAHVGDSRAYLLRDGRCDQLTEDHSLVNEKLKAGLITEEEAKNHRMRNVITRSLGYQEDVEIDVQVRGIRRGDVFMLCSDGLSGYFDAAEIGQVLGAAGPQDAARRLVELACERGGEDNITCVVAKMEETT